MIDMSNNSIWVLIVLLIRYSLYKYKILLQTSSNKLLFDPKYVFILFVRTIYIQSTPITGKGVFSMEIGI